jgi:hypothetical protein
VDELLLKGSQLKAALDFLELNPWDFEGAARAAKVSYVDLKLEMERNPLPFFEVEEKHLDRLERFYQLAALGLEDQVPDGFKPAYAKSVLERKRGHVWAATEAAREKARIARENRFRMGGSSVVLPRKRNEGAAYGKVLREHLAGIDALVEMRLTGGSYGSKEGSGTPEEGEAGIESESADGGRGRDGGTRGDVTESD